VTGVTDRRDLAALYDPAFEHDACGVGFVAHIEGKRSHEIVKLGLTVLDNLVHRGATGSDPDTGDGAGILMQVPDRFLRDVVGFDLPAPPGSYGVGMLFLPRSPDARAECREIVERVIKQEGQQVLGWRDVPTDSSQIGVLARETEPHIAQVFVGRGKTTLPDAFERKLYVIRKVIEREVATALVDSSGFYIPSLSSKTLIYKGLVLPHQIRGYFPDLVDERVETALALVHQRFSTNTFPSWPLAHPYRYIAHNGEINTIRGNRNWMKAREAGLTSQVLGDDIRKCYPLVSQEGSDSGTLDNAVELLVMGGRSLAHAMMVLIPEAWAGNTLMDSTRRAFYEYNACVMEPWDGPAAVAFTDGVQIGATLDRNGLRPARYTVTHDGLVVLASETGVIDFAPKRVKERGRLQPGRIFLVDTAQGRILPDDEVKGAICAAHPYGKWLEGNRIDLFDLPAPEGFERPEHFSVLARQRAFGYTSEEVKLLITPMARSGEEALGSMGTDTPLAVLSHRPVPLFGYFKQLFAQVTNPPIDPIREELVMSLADYIGTDGSLLEDTPENARQIKLSTPILTSRALERLRVLSDENPERLHLHTIRCVFRVDRPEGELERAVERVCRQASEALERGVGVIVLSDRDAGPEYAPIPSLLAVSAVHHHLIREGTRVKVALIVESGDAREVHHIACLVGYGASAVNPYLLFDTADDLIRQGTLTDLTPEKARHNIVKAVNKGLLKVMSKMGISTVQSYRGAQIFEAIGISSAVISRYFTGTPSRIEGIGLGDLEREVRRLHGAAWPKEPLAGGLDLEVGGEYQWRRSGEWHAVSPDMVEKLQKAVRDESFETFQQFSDAVNVAGERAATLRGLMALKPAGPEVPLEEVEAASSIVKRFATGAMSLGSISRESHEALAVAMNRLGGKSNTGEGGEDPERFGGERRSAIKQVASGRFGVTTHYLVHADELQIKMAQGAKPGEGGQLMGHKVDDYIARIRRSTPGVTLISPPPHHDIYSIEDLAQLIFDLKNVNPKARISVKLVAEVGVGTVAAGVAKAHADHILISGYEGGTGASPVSSVKHAGVPWELGLAEAQQVLVANGLRGRVVVQADGQLKTGRDVVVAALLGAEEFGFSTAPLVAQGCIMMRVCHLGTCPVGIATQDPELRKKFAGKPEHVVNYFFFVAEEVRKLMAQLGFRTVDEMVGRADCLDTSGAVRYWKARGVDLTKLLAPAPGSDSVAVRCVESQDHGLDTALDYQLIERAKAALEDARPVRFSAEIRNANRTCGSMLSGEIARRFGESGLPDDTIRIDFTGAAGQSFGAFLAPGLTLTLVGEANDYLGKGMSGGKIIVHPPSEAGFRSHENIIAGNTLLYGATGGEAYLSGVVGERFAVRNSGAIAVVEGCGDHGCEYMTGGTIVVLGRTGRNFGAGMSGGVAYVWDDEASFAARLNPDPNLLKEPIEPDSDDDQQLKALVQAHFEHTGSARAQVLLADWPAARHQFIKVIGAEYKRLVANQRADASLTRILDCKTLPVLS
jgi:glutamate synthase domain-containing protein 2/glutamate synthase domain-containing protein 1/glutamate synthase domain-containing protein 3